MDDNIPSQDLDIINMLPDPVLIIDTKGIIQWCNDATLNLADEDKEGLIGQRFTKFSMLRLSDIPKYIKIFAAILKGNDVRPIKVTWDRVDGSSQQSEIHVSLFRTLNGKRAILVVAKNITMQEQIREAYFLARNSIDNTSDPILWFDDNSRFRFANEAACKALGYSEEELMKIKIYDIDPDFTEERWTSVLKELKAKKEITFESSWISKSKQRFPVRITAQRKYVEGQVLNFANVKDITESKTAELAIHQIEERNRIVVDSMSDLILIYDHEERLIDYYTSNESLLYLTWEEMEGRKLEEFMPRDYVIQHKESILITRSTGENTCFEYELEIDGISRWFQATIMLLSDKNRIVVAIKDVTEKKLIEIALERSEERFRNLFLNATVGLFRTNQAGKVLECNLMGAKLLGFNSPKEVIEEYNLREQYTDANRREQLLNELSDKGEVSNFQAQITKHDGTPFWIEMSSKWYHEEEFLETVVIDITKRKETESKLRESEERFRKIFESTPMGMFLYELDNSDQLIFTDSNPAADMILGIDCKQLLGKPIEEAFPGLVGSEVPERYKATAREGTSWHNEEINYDEGTINGAFDVYAFQTMERKMVASFLDITAKRKAQEAVKSSTRRYQELMENLPAGVGITDLNDELTFVNPAYCKLFGYEASELIGMNILDTITPEDRKRILSQTEIRKTGQSSTYEMEIIRKDGTNRTIRISAVPERNDSGEVIGTIGLLIDISEASRAEADLKTSEERLRNLIEQLPLGVAIADLSEDIELANQAMAVLLMKEKVELVGSNLLEFLKSESADRMKEQTENRKEGMQSTYNIEMIRADGSERDVRIFAAPNYNSSGHTIGSVGIFQDITEQRANESVRARQEQEINLYGSLLRHDLRNDLGLILSYIEAVQMLLEDPDPEILSFMDSALASIERMANLLKNFGRPQDVKEVDMVEFIGEISSETQEAEKNLKIHVAYDNDSEPVRITTGSLLALVFMNLFRNSAQHAGTHPEVSVIVSKHVSQIEIVVSDNGQGVPEEFQKRLFARGTSSKGEAGGLGLYLCRQIIEGTGGTIDLLKEAKGATFQILLPMGT